MTVTRFAAVLASALVYAVAAGAANAGDGWRIVESAGKVKVGGAAFQPVAVTPNQVLPADSWVETAASGRVVLMRGQESIAVGPSSRVYLPDEEVNGNTQVLQTLGSALYQIGKQKAPHFQVDTPYLAAVVKGTTFTVNVGEQATSVDVTEGVVEVATPDRADVEFVRAGFTGLVSRDQRGDVVVAPTEHNDAPPPKSKASKDKSAANGRVVIPAPIGEMNVDVADASDGLASGVAPNNTGATKGAGDVGKERILEAGSAGPVSGVTKVVDLAPVPVALADAPVGTVTPILAPVLDVVDVAPVGIGGGKVDVAPVLDVLPVIDVAPVLDVGGGLGVGVGVDVGGDNGVGSGNGVGVGVSVGNGNSLNVGVGVGIGGGGLNVGLGVGGSGGLLGGLHIGGSK